MVAIKVKSDIDLSSIMPDGKDPGEVTVMTNKKFAETQIEKKEEEETKPSEELNV